MKYRILAALVLITAALAAPPSMAVDQTEKFAWAWPLEAQQENDLWRVRLPAELIESLHLADASDLNIVDRRGQPVSFTRIEPKHLIEVARSSQALEHHSSRLHTAAPQSDGLELVLQQGDARLVLRSPQPDSVPDTRGRLLFEALLAAPETPLTGSAHQLVIALDSQRSLDLDCWLKDADEPEPAQLRVDFTQIGDSRPRRFESRVAINTLPTAWYLACYGSRAIPDDLVLSQARLDSQVSHDHRELEQIEPTLDIDAATSGVFSFETNGPFRVHSIILTSQFGNQLSELIIESRSPQSNGQTEQGWQRRADAVFSTLGDTRELTIKLNQSQRRDQRWRIRSNPPLAEAPQVRLAVEIEELAFLAQGEPPWRLLSGSLDSGPIRADQRIIDFGQAEFGPAWEWPLIEAGPREMAGGSDALVPPPVPLPWSRYLLWGILFAAAALVIWLAASLLKKSE